MEKFCEVVNDQTSVTGEERNILTLEERTEWQIEWRRESNQLGGPQDADSIGREV